MGVIILRPGRVENDAGKIFPRGVGAEQSQLLYPVVRGLEEALGCSQS